MRKCEEIRQHFTDATLDRRILPIIRKRRLRGGHQRSQFRLVRLQLSLLLRDTVQFGLRRSSLCVIVSSQTIGFVLGRRHFSVVILSQTVSGILCRGGSQVAFPLEAIRFS